MIRPDWSTWFMRQAYVTAERGSCQRKQVGAIIVRDRDRRIIASGYNGAPRGMPDCLEAGCDVRVIDGRESCVRTMHAESTALDLCGPLAEAHTLYTTVIPCRLCALRIIQAGITRVIYHEFYQSQGTLEVQDLFNGCDRDSLKALGRNFNMSIEDAIKTGRINPALRPRVIMERLEVPMGSVKASYEP
jgi:dCMP deaminase